MKNTRIDDLKFIAIQALFPGTFVLTSLSKWKSRGVPDHLRLAGEFHGTANAFFYFGATLIALYLTERSKEISTE